MKDAGQIDHQVIAAHQRDVAEIRSEADADLAEYEPATWAEAVSLAKKEAERPFRDEPRFRSLMDAVYVEAGAAVDAYESGVEHHVGLR